tara:strand:- start:109 stop:672 length:564 start_codon:yes stop_codon:yes gene_type:complete
MRIIHNAVSDELIDRCLDEIQKKKTQDVWGISKWKWNAPLTKGFKQFCFSSRPEVYQFNDLRNQLTQYFHRVPTNINYHLWLPGSGINWHDDNMNLYGATLYLNDWVPEKGGVFMWREKDTEELKCMHPQRNMLMINEYGEDHAVTPIMVNEGAGLRLSVQIFCQYPNEELNQGQPSAPVPPEGHYD